MKIGLANVVAATTQLFLNGLRANDRIKGLDHTGGQSDLETDNASRDMERRSEYLLLELSSRIATARGTHRWV